MNNAVCDRWPVEIQDHWVGVWGRSLRPGNTEIGREFTVKAPGLGRFFDSDGDVCESPGVAGVIGTREMWSQFTSFCGGSQQQIMHITQLIINKEIIIARLDGIFDCIYRVMSVICIKKMIDIW